ncbi:hypothetical protein [Streptomyces ipomoeae]|uniref:hypothetical protein n=1 Tax=Streptomyces ipomoeae TaxID=103232 RepID=UPI001146CD01|nr:hypothetical protein [Streptomyces ipomoeae]TQE33046.1 hypothetical protein Sipo7851_21320 [Streptomyces ipomoeae]
MGITFTAEHRPPVGHVVSCGCPDAILRAPRFGAWHDALAAADRANAAPEARLPLPGCEMPDICVGYPLDAYGVDPDGTVPWVDLSSANAPLVLDALGFPLEADDDAVSDALEDGVPLDGADLPGVVIPIAVVDAHGQLPAADFRARVLTALGLAPEDAGRPDIQLGRTFVGGRPAGYLQRRLGDLYELADWCAAHGRDVAWH